MVEECDQWEQALLYTRIATERFTEARNYIETNP